MQHERREIKTITDAIQTSLVNSGLYGDFLTIITFIIGASFSYLHKAIAKMFRKKPKNDTLDDSIKYLLHNILSQSKADGCMIGFPTTKNNLKKSPTHNITWDYKIHKPNILLQPPTALATEFSTNSSKDWVEVDSIFGVYFFKTFYLEGLILAYLLVYDTAKINKETLQKIDTQDLEKYLTLLIQNND